MALFNLGRWVKSYQYDFPYDITMYGLLLVIGMGIVAFGGILMLLALNLTSDGSDSEAFYVGTSTFILGLVIVIVGFLYNRD